jgi:hypothetical protein
MTTTLLLVVSVVGCQNHTHGVCDCDFHSAVTTGTPEGVPTPWPRGDAVVVPAKQNVLDKEAAKPNISDKEEGKPNILDKELDKE